MNHLLPRTETEFDYILFKKFDVALWFDFLVVYERPICGFQVDYVRAHSTPAGSIRSFVVDQTELKYSLFH